MARTIRVYWGNMTSSWANVNWRGVIDHDSVVHVSISEATNTPRSPVP